MIASNEQGAKLLQTCDYSRKMAPMEKTYLDKFTELHDRQNDMATLLKYCENRKMNRHHDGMAVIRRLKLTLEDFSTKENLTNGSMGNFFNIKPFDYQEFPTPRDDYLDDTSGHFVITNGKQMGSHILVCLNPVQENSSPDIKVAELWTHEDNEIKAKSWGVRELACFGLTSGNLRDIRLLDYSENFKFVSLADASKMIIEIFINQMTDKNAELERRCRRAMK